MSRTISKIVFITEADPGFSGGGGANDYVPMHAHYERGTELPFGRARLRALEAIGLFNALSSYLSLIVKHSDKKTQFIKF